MVKRYVPERGDMVWLSFDPQSGKEQKGHRPALTISPKEYNEKVGLAIFCPITSKVKGYPFEVKINCYKIDGAVLSDQVKNLDWKERKCKFIGKLNPNKMTEVLEKIKVLISQ